MDTTRGRLSDSPFLGQESPATVWVSQHADPYQNARQILRQLDLTMAKGKKVLLKPNAGRIASPGQGITTDPRVVAAAADAFLEAGADVSVGDSPITGVRGLEALDACGIAAVARERSCGLLNLDEPDPIHISLPQGEIIRSLTVCRPVLESDLVVSLPVMKTHMHTVVSLSVKNMKGCLWRRSKVDLHMLPRPEGMEDKPLDVAIADMAWALRPHLSLIDGTVGQEGLGPSAGDPKPLGVVVLSADAFAADAVACHLMGLDPVKVPHLRIGAERGYGTTDIESLRVFPEDWKSFASPFALAPQNLSIEFPGIRVLDRNSCSACQSTLLLLLKRHFEDLSGYFPPGQPIVIAIGKGHEEVPLGTLCVGNCTARHKDKGIFVSGCPPVGSQILRTLEQERKGTE